MGEGVAEGRITNGFLRALPRDSLARLSPHLEQVELTRRQQIYAAGDHADMVYFVNKGLVSLVKPMSDGGTVEVGCVGSEGVVCLSGLLGLREAMLESVAHLPGEALRMKTTVFRDEIQADPALGDLVRRYIGLSVEQMIQTSACNALHLLEERCCRWLLVAHDNAGTDTFPLTHEFLALMLGVHRPGVSIAARTLQLAGLIDYGSGQVTVLDRAGLEAGACECHDAVRGRVEQVLGRAPGPPGTGPEAMRTVPNRPPRSDGAS